LKTVTSFKNVNSSQKFIEGSPAKQGESIPSSTFSNEQDIIKMVAE
jgi:hypothetical protein